MAIALMQLGACASTLARATARPDKVDDLLQQLEVVETWKRRWVIRDIASMGTGAAPKATPRLLALLEHGAWDDRPAAAAALGWLKAEAAVPALTTALAAPDWRLTFSACRSLERLGRQSLSARARLEEIASRHWLPKVRAAAAAAVLAVDGRPDPPSELADDFSYWHPFKHECRPESSGSGWQEAPADGHTIEYAVPAGMLIGTDHGEFGGDVGFAGAHGSHQLVMTDVNPMGFANLGSDLVVVEGLAHLGSSHGKIWRLHTEGGRWLAAPMAELPGAPRAFRVTVSGGLEIDTYDGTLVVSATGAIESVRCSVSPRRTPFPRP